MYKNNKLFWLLWYFDMLPPDKEDQSTIIYCNLQYLCRLPSKSVGWCLSDLMVPGPCLTRGFTEAQLYKGGDITGWLAG